MQRISTVIKAGILLSIALSTTAFGQLTDLTNLHPKTICNPVNLSYRFCLDAPSRREAADPTMVVYKNEYYLFASKSGGYFHSKDLIHWDLITSPDLPLEDYAPTAVVMNDTLYFMASFEKPPFVIYKTTDPASGKWQVANAAFPIQMVDPDLFVDDDGRLFFYYGCSNVNPIYGVELNAKTLNPIGESKALLNSNTKLYGWERPGDYNTKSDKPWIEGSWMIKRNGKYYLHYAGPGTEYKSYNDGVYVSDKPLGPFTLAPHNPASYKPEGFIAGAGHGSTFQDNYGNYWHIATMTISQKHNFERRLGLFPVFFDSNDQLFAYTAYGDFPFVIPTKKINDPKELSPGWMLLSYHKPVEVSSELADHPKRNAVDEEIRTFWSAKTGNQGEWISMDLQKECTVNAVQLNYYENETKLFGRTETGICHQYLLEYSSDNKNWKTAVDKTKNQADVPHDYIELTSPAKARYIRLTNYHVPDGTFALCGLRVFGNAGGKAPIAVNDVHAIRQEDRCVVKINWNAAPNAIGYTIRYGETKNALHHSYQVLGTNAVTIGSLNSSTTSYYFAVDAFNENGITVGSKIIEVK